MESSEVGPAIAPAPPPRWPRVVASGGLVVAALAGWVTMRAGAPWVFIVQDQLVGLAFLLAGTIACQRRPDNSIGLALLAIGYSWFIPDFQSSTSPAVASVAYANRRLVNAISTYLLLAYPSGRLGSRLARFSIGVVAFLAVIFFPGRLFLTDRIPAELGQIDRLAAPGCGCANPFQLVDSAALLASLEELGLFVSVANSLLVIGIIGHRLVTGTRPMRRALAPVVLAAIVGVGVFAFNLTFAALAPASKLLESLRWLLTLARVAVPIGFLVGLLRMRMDKAAVADLVVRMHGQRALGPLQAQIARALRDPTVQLGYWSPAAAAYVDESGRALVLPASGTGRTVMHVQHGATPLGVLVHEAVLDDDRDLLESVSAAFAMAVDRERLATSVRAQADDAHALPTGPVTFLYADVEGSTHMLARLGDRYADVLSEERRIVRSIVRDAGGVEIDSRADEFFGVFAQGADPLGAALAIHRRLRDRAWPDGVEVKVRIGLHGGEPQRTDEGYVGLDVHRASRIGSAGHGGQTLLSQSARDRLGASLPAGATLRCLGVFALKGLPEPDPIWQLDVSDLARDFAPLRASS